MAGDPADLTKATVWTTDVEALPDVKGSTTTG
jgi:hypothetical protein